MFASSGSETVEADTLVLAPDGTAEERGIFVYYFSSFYATPPSRSVIARRGTWTSRWGNVDVVWAVDDQGPLAWWWEAGRLARHGGELTLPNAGSIRPRTLVFERTAAVGP